MATNQTDESNLQIVDSLLETTLSASLGTIHPSGMPFVSLVNVARFAPLEMVMLLSGLAQHTRNLRHDSRCSLLLIGDVPTGTDKMTGQRVTLTGEITELVHENDSAQRTAIVAHHPGAAMYADFKDFAIYQMQITEAHLVAGFGRIETLQEQQLQTLLV